MFNGRCIFNSCNEKALELADKHNKIKTIGSDAHFTCEVGKTYISIKPFQDKKEFVKNLKRAYSQGNFRTHSSSVIDLLKGRISKELKKLS